MQGYGTVGEGEGGGAVAQTPNPKPQTPNPKPRKICNLKMSVRFHLRKLKVILFLTAILFVKVCETEDLIETESGAQVIDEESENGCK